MNGSLPIEKIINNAFMDRRLTQAEMDGIVKQAQADKTGKTAQKAIEIINRILLNFQSYEHKITIDRHDDFLSAMSRMQAVITNTSMDSCEYEAVTVSGLSGVRSFIAKHRPESLYDLDAAIKVCNIRFVGNAMFNVRLERNYINIETAEEYDTGRMDNGKKVIRHREYITAYDHDIMFDTGDITLESISIHSDGDIKGFNRETDRDGLSYSLGKFPVKETK
jgi:limonene-1,2-epoxide hydrolase